MSTTTPAVRFTCDCGSDTFWLAGVEVEAICIACGDRTPLGIGAFTITGVSPSCVHGGET